MAQRNRTWSCCLTATIHLLLLCSVESFSALPDGASPSSYPNVSPNARRLRSQSTLFVANLRDADLSEMMVGGERYEMVPLPDSMVDTTLFVGNLCEFVKDEDLDNLFQTVSTLKSVPACVSRKANWDSLLYGFVTFPNIKEKEKALIKFHGYELNGRRLKVECIRDIPGMNRVRVPEKMVAYMCGEAKKTGDGRVNTMRRVSRAKVNRMSKGQDGGDKKSSKNKKIAKKPDVPMRLNEKEQEELMRAERKGFVSLLTTAYRRGRKSSALANVHREWCDAREKPQIVHCKASGGRPLDHVIVDLSPLRSHGILDDPKAADDFLIKWKAQILLAAEKAGMDMRDDYMEDNAIGILEGEDGEIVTELVMTMDTQAWATQPIWSLPAVSLGVFEGERPKAKAMAKELAELWDIPESMKETTFGGGDSKQGKGKQNAKSKQNVKSLSDHRRRGRNPYNLHD
jgi:hypothetical protein